MSAKLIIAEYAQQADLLGAVRAARLKGFEVVDVYAPHAVHGLDEILGWPRSRLAVACFFGGVIGSCFALWFQYWASAQDWPLNVGGRPWNSLPAFIPVVFESMVLLAGLCLVFAWLCRCELFPGKKAVMPVAGLTDSQFALVLRDRGEFAGTTARQILLDCHAVSITEATEGGLR